MTQPLRLLLGVFFLLLLALGASCGANEAYIKGEIQQAKQCDKDDDCVDVGGKCPFGCYVAVHKDEAARIKDLVSRYNTNCAYDCIELDKIVCESKRCTAKTK